MKKFLLLFSLSLSIFADQTLKQQIDSFQSKSKLPDNIRSEFVRATKELKSSGIEKSAMDKGVMVPSFMVNGKKIEDLYKKKPLVIKFYRGHWCPYCILELKEYQKRHKEISRYGNLIALVPDLDKEIKKTKRTHKLNFPIYRDENHKIGKAFGIAFKVDKKVLELYKGFNINLADSQGNEGEELAMPGTYVVDQAGKIVYAFVDADYTKRAPLNDVISALKSAAGKN